MTDRKFALLIDAENISAKYINCILDEMTKHGMITYKRIYGDWTNSQTTKWKETLLSNSIIPVQQFSNTTGKNATDSTLIIDAMDILYTQHVEGYCIVSSDSDFTRLATRLRESGMVVIGMGEKKTPRSFRAACTLFTDLNVLIDVDDLKDGDEKPILESKKYQGDSSDMTQEIKKEDIESVIASVITENANSGKDTTLGEIGNSLVHKYPDFDVRNYGYSLLSKFLGDFDAFELMKNGTIITVCLKDKGNDEEIIKNYIVEVVKQGGLHGVDLSELSNKVHLRFADFNVKDFGYSRFYKFVQDMPEMDLRATGEKTKKRVFPAVPRIKKRQ